tara:strand:- start:5964 stop:6293 length:330 start_codon:yes stop_codon:yes gene_type:complete
VSKPEKGTDEYIFRLVNQIFCFVPSLDSDTGYSVQERYDMIKNFVDSDAVSDPQVLIEYTLFCEYIEDYGSGGGDMSVDMKDLASQAVSEFSFDDLVSRTGGASDDGNN